MNFGLVDWFFLIVIGIIVLAMWFAFRDIEKLSSKSEEKKK